MKKSDRKATARQTNGNAQKNAISYFDLGDQKSCDLETFTKALDKFGCNFKKHEIRALFVKYDTDKSGRLDYE